MDIGAWSLVTEWKVAMVHGRVVPSGIGIEDIVNKDIEGCSHRYNMQANCNDNKGNGKFVEEYKDNG